MQCPGCASALEELDRFCSACGAAISSYSQAPTMRAEARPEPRRTPTSSRVLVLLVAALAAYGFVTALGGRGRTRDPRPA